jgi:hypothetical protein
LPPGEGGDLRQACVGFAVTHWGHID